MIQGKIHSLESFGSADGPGVRFVVFLQGCGMRCLYCHNADTWRQDGGVWMTADEVLDKAERYRAYWGETGGITVSGGEPLLQIDFLQALLSEAKARGMHTCIDTAGQPFTETEPFFSKFQALMRDTDLLLVDIKHIEDEMHRRLTGVSNANTLAMLRYLAAIQKPVWIRQVLLPGWTDDEKTLQKTRRFLDTLSNVEKVEVLPYHTLGVYKWKELGIPYRLADIEPPSAQSLARALEILSVPAGETLQY